MQKPFQDNFETQLRSKVENYSIKPSSKVWEGLSTKLEEAAVSNTSSVSSIAKGSSFFGNWMLNVLIPAVVLVGSGTIFYFNANKNSNVAISQSSKPETTKSVKAKDFHSEIETAKSNSKDNSEAGLKTVASSAANEISRTDDDKSSVISGTQIIDGAVSIEQSFGYSKTIGKRSVVSKTDSETSAKIESDITFSKADLDKISKKEVEHENLSEIKERNIKHFNF